MRVEVAIREVEGRVIGVVGKVDIGVVGIARIVIIRREENDVVRWS